ncbi:MAG: PilN domain-containing protein, partial [Longimicrobiales bacterium]
MSDVVGVELCTDVVRAVALDRWRAAPRKTLEIEWDPSRAADLVSLLRQQLGPANRIALSVGLGFLHVKQVKLPPAPIAERRRMLTLEPDRFFPVQDQSVAVSLVDDASFAFAMDAELLERWTLAFEEWAPVENVEAAPLSLARALGKSGSHGSFLLPAHREEWGVVELHGGRIRSARRVPAAAGTPEAQDVPGLGSVRGAFACALGAARGVDAAIDAMLLSDAHAGRVRQRRLRRLSLTVAACAIAFGLSLWAIDGSRERTLERIREELAVLARDAQPAVELRDRLAAMDREAVAIRELSGQRPNPLRVMAALSERMPAGATVLSVKSSGDDWQIDGTAADAAAIVPLLAADDRFQDVRFLSASARFQENNRTY